MIYLYKMVNKKTQKSGLKNNNKSPIFNIYI